MSAISIPSRSTSESSPGCGPDAVATAPVTTITAQAATPPSATMRSHAGAGDAASPRWWLQASNATMTASATTTSASRKCDITASGCRSSSTVIPPSGAWATVPRNAASARIRARRDRPRDPSRSEPHQQRGKDAREAHDPVAELDQRMAVGRGENGLAAVRPVLATEPRARQPHERARDDDQPENPDGSDRESKKAAWRHGPPPDPGHGASLRARSPIAALATSAERRRRCRPRRGRCATDRDPPRRTRLRARRRDPRGA